MDEAMRCDRVALIQQGKILSIEKPEVVRSEFSGKLFNVKAKEKYKLLIAIRNFPGTKSAYPFGDSLHVTFNTDEYDNTLFDLLKKEGINDAVIEEASAGIEDRFLQLMGRAQI